MSKIIFVQPDGTQKQVHAHLGASLMEVAVNNMVSGIDADCGGACACATCHIYIDKSWANLLPPKKVMEADLLECASYPTDESRLACQVRVTEATDGLIVHLPPR